MNSYRFGLFNLRFYIIIMELLYVLSFPLTRGAYAIQTKEPRVSMLHIFIRADINDVHFRNIWVFRRQSKDGDWQVIINLPDGANSISFDEPNKINVMADSGVLYKNMAGDSLIDSVDFCYLLPNKNGTCQTKITLGYPTDLLIVAIAGQDAKLQSNVLKLNKSNRLLPQYSKVYSASDLSAGQQVNITISALPRRNTSLWQTVSIVGLGLIFIAGLLIMRLKGRALKAQASYNEAGFK